MTQQALGLIEAVGLPVAIEAADAALKAANVILIGYEKTKGGGLIVVKLRGDVGAVKAAVEAGVASASRVGKIFSWHIIPRPHESTELIIGQVDRGPERPLTIEQVAPAPPPVEIPAHRRPRYRRHRRPRYRRHRRPRLLRRRRSRRLRHRRPRLPAPPPAEATGATAGRGARNLQPVQ